MTLNEQDAMSALARLVQEIGFAMYRLRDPDTLTIYSFAIADYAAKAVESIDRVEADRKAAIEAEHPAVVAQYATERPGSRRFLIKGGNAL